MTISKRYALSLLLLALTVVSLPSGASACGGHEPDYGNGGIIQTPLSAKGRFVFFTRVSRRLLREAVAQHQRPMRPALPRAEI